VSGDVRFGGIGGYGAGDGPAAVVVLHEWDGRVPHIRDVTDRVAAWRTGAPASPAQFPTWFAGMPNVAVHIYPGTRHAFFNDTYPDCYDAAAARLSWDRTRSFFREHLRP
jgi:dienelactone hydrolase